MISEIEFLLNEKKQRTDKIIINFKLTIFTAVFITFSFLNSDKYFGPNATSNDLLLLAMWLLYPIYLCFFKKITLRKYQLKCAECSSGIELNGTYKQSKDLESLNKEACNNCKAVLDLDKLKFKRQK